MGIINNKNKSTMKFAISAMAVILGVSAVGLLEESNTNIRAEDSSSIFTQKCAKGWCHKEVPCCGEKVCVKAYKSMGNCRTLSELNAEERARIYDWSRYK